MRLLLLTLLLIPAIGRAWTLSEHCELIRESSEGPVALSPTKGGLLLFFPEGFVSNDTRVKVGIGSHSWRVLVVGGAVELRGGVKPLQEKNWLQVHTDDGEMLGVSLKGSTEAWQRLESCEPPTRGGWLMFSGEITVSSDDEVIAAIRRQRPEGLMLDSVGGLAEEAQRIGFAVREGGLATRVAAGGRCLSECTFVLAAGEPRSADSEAHVGVPPAFFTKGLGVFGGEAEAALDSAAYLRAMGVDGGKLAVLATSARGTDIRAFTPAELAELRLVDTAIPAETARVGSRLPTELDAGGWWWIAILFGGSVFLWTVVRNWIRP